MKRFILFFILFVSAECVAQTLTVSGKIMDAQAGPIPFANIYVGTQGSMSDGNGAFAFSLFAEGESFILNVSSIGYKPYRQEFPVRQDSFFVVVTLEAQVADLEEVVVKGVAQRIKGNGSWNNISPIAIATTGGSAGDLYRALQIMPGVQVQGESGKLVVRGGDSRETQTYIDDMHVPAPYTATGENMPARGRYSPFMFEGINFSSGGFAQEYGDGLSAVLPLFTKDESKLTKWGVNPSTIGLAGGGTRAFERGSVSLNLDYCNLGPYLSAVPNRLNMTSPYQTGSAASQLRFMPNDRSILKSYVSYDRTQFAQGMMHLKENNLYVNTTFRHTTGNGYRLFVGTAVSGVVRHVTGARQEGDTFEDKMREIHLKAKVSKRLTGFIHLSAGVESFIRRFGNEYADSAIIRNLSARPGLVSAFAIATLYPVRNLNVDISARTDNRTLSPRISVNYNLSGINLSATAGQYVQQPEAEYLYANRNIESARCVQYVAGAKYIHENKIYRVELYYKDYDRLPLVDGDRVTSGGYGYSKGLDLYLGDAALFGNVEYQASCSFNLSKRKSGTNRELSMPYYAPRHNASLAVKHTVIPLKSIIGVTCLYASGRPYNGGFTEPYNSLDASITYLACPKLIVYGSISNLLGRHNRFSNAGGALVRPAYDRFIYIGVFISLGGKSAYDVSNF
jgi:hypothetical protein